MTASEEIFEACIRFAPGGARWPEWMVATVDGVRLSAAPVNVGDLPAAITELVARLGAPTRVEVRHLDGTVRQAVVDPAHTRLEQLIAPVRRA